MDNIKIMNLVRKLQRKLKRTKITLSIYFVSTDHEYIIVDNAHDSLDTYRVILGDSSSSMVDYPDCYYCVTTEEFEDTLKFICRYNKLYTTQIDKNDAMAKFEFESLDNILDSIPDDK